MKPTLTFITVLFLSTISLSLSPAWSQNEPGAPKSAIKLEISTDFLNLHLKGTAPEGTTAVEYRVAESGAIGDDSVWLPVSLSASQPTAFSIAIPLWSSRWSALQVRALKGEQETARQKTCPDKDEFKLLTSERIAALSEPERKAWSAYIEKSQVRAAEQFDMMAAECRMLARAKPALAPGNRAGLKLDSDTPEAWFASDEARKLAEAIVSYQTPAGGWSKAVDYKAGPRQPGTHWSSQKGDLWHYCGTFDNRTTTEQIKLLAGVHSATKRDDAKTAALRGLEYVFEAQYPNGGWPQNYPLESGYHEGITLNDDAMVHILGVLLAVAEKREPFAFADDSLCERAKAAFERGIECLVKMQVNIDGVPTVWCAQHHPLTLEPVKARAMEPPSLSGGESAAVVKFLMRRAPITDTTKAMIETAVAWFGSHKLTGLRKTKNAEGKTDFVEDPASQELYWARFYDLQTGKAIFPGSQDGINYPTFREMAAKNKVAYDFVTDQPAELITKEMERWKERLKKGK